MVLFLNILNKFPAIVSFIILFSFIVILSFILRWLWKNVLIRFAEKTSTNLDRYLFSATKNSAQLIFIAAGFNFTWNLYGEAIIQMLSGVKNINIMFIDTIINHLCFIFLAFSIILFLWNVVFSFFDWYERDITKITSSKLDEKIVPTFRKIIKFFLLIIIIMIIADHFELPISKIWAMAGIGSLAVAFAAKDTLANIISGIIILFDRPFLVGDRIELSDGTFGDVIDIGIRSTKILSFDNTIFILPNAEISNKRVTNHAYPDFKIKIRQKIGVAYGSDIEKVKKIINDILDKHPGVLNNPPWGIYFLEFGDSSLNLLIIYWISDYKNKFNITDKINTEINNRFLEENITIPFPQRDIHVINQQ
jgi:small-conductance mechanosensitive channel